MQFGFAVPFGFLLRHAKKYDIAPQLPPLGRMIEAQNHIQKPEI